MALVCGYALLGSTWLIMKTEDITREWARKCTYYLFGYVAFFMGLGNLCMPMRKKQWTWFVILWCAGLLAVGLPACPAVCLFSFIRRSAASKKGGQRCDSI